MSRFLATLIVLLGAVSVGRSSPVDHVPAESTLVFSLETKELLSKPVIQKEIVPEIRAVLKNYPAITLMLAALKIDPFKDISSLLISVARLDRGEALVILSGQYNVPRIQAAAKVAATVKGDQLQIHTVKGKTIYEMKSQGLSVYSSVADQETILFALSKSYLASVLLKDQTKKPRMLASAIQLAQKARTMPDSWSVALQSKQVQKWLNLTPLGQGASLIRAFTSRTILSENVLTLSWEIHTKNAQSARALSQMANQVRPLLLLGKLSPIGREVIDDILKSLQISVLRSMVQTQVHIRVSSLASLLGGVGKAIK